QNGAHKHAVTHVGGTTAGYQKYWYDQNGNATRRISGSQDITLSYDAENRLTAMSGGVTSSYVYDGDGKRVKETAGGATTVYIGNTFEWTGSTATMKSYYYAGGTRVAMRTETASSGTVNYLLSDHLGSQALTLTSAGARLNTNTELRYMPYGAPRYTAGTTPTSYNFTGQRKDSSSGLLFYNARWYDPAVGRFLQADTIVPGAGDPQALNRYSYTRNNALRYNDPTGHWFETAWDVLNIGWDIYEVKQDPSLLNIGALVVDVGAAVLPFVPAGAGLIARGGKAAKAVVEVASHADEVADATKIGGKVTEEAAASTARRAGRQVSQEVVEQAIKSKVGPASDLLRQRIPDTEVHHLIEQRFANEFGVKPGDLPAIRLDKTFHQQEVTSRLFSKGNLPTGGSYSPQEIWNAYQKVYGADGINRLNWLDAIWPYFQKMGVVR
ncbi:MAG: RHS repeat-associated core domain-containing protein, partial [Anaerolineae bacterium]